ncbi:MAG TPA: helix-turn-helix transcriptional regulator [Actinomycetota bacterium]|nr:helix-turn-helix transcriptional regulator [Actinomycetota bacterium]
MNRDESTRRDERAVYVISVAAELAGVHPQTLRIYERKGLLRPKRTSGNSRRYSERDIERLRMIQELTQAGGVNLAGVKRIMQMQRELDRLRDRISDLEAELSRRPIVAPGRRGGTEIVPLRSSVVLRWGETPP